MNFIKIAFNGFLNTRREIANKRKQGPLFRWRKKGVGRNIFLKLGSDSSFLAVQFYDEDSFDEERFLLLGMSSDSRILMVVHCEQGEGGENLRIISARKATKNEQQHYKGGLS